jgi:GntR family transcriptional regulator
VAFLQDTLAENTLTPDELREGFTGSVLDFILQRGKPQLMQAKTEISAVGATHDIARALQIQRGDVLLQLTSQLFSGDGRIVDYSLGFFIPGYFRFHVNRKLNGGNSKGK